MTEQQVEHDAAASVFNKAAIVVAMRDTALALDVCEILHRLEGDYELRRIRPGGDGSPDAESAFTGRPIIARLASPCEVCRRSIAVGDECLYSPTLRRVAHVRCGEVAT